MGDPNPGVLDAANQIFVLSFDLLDSEIQQAPAQLLAALTSPRVEAEIKKTLLDYARAQVKKGGEVVASGEEAKKLLEALGTSATDAAKKEVLEKIKKLPEFKKLSDSIDQFQKAAKSSGLGVWIDENQKVLYVIGAGLVIGTATALYVTKTGGSLVNSAVSQIAGKQHEVLKIGGLGLNAGLWKFQPDAKIFGAKIGGSGEWKQLKLDFKLGVMAEGSTIKEVEGEAVVKSGPISVQFTGDAKPQTKVVDLALKVDYKKDGFNFGLGAAYKDALLSGEASAGYTNKNVNIGLTGNAGQKDGRVQYGALLNVTVTF